MSPTRFPALMTRGSSAKSEERRVGEEGRFRGWPDHLKKKKSQAEGEGLGRSERKSQKPKTLQRSLSRTPKQSQESGIAHGLRHRLVTRTITPSRKNTCQC